MRSLEESSITDRVRIMYVDAALLCPWLWRGGGVAASEGTGRVAKNSEAPPLYVVCIRMYRWCVGGGVSYRPGLIMPLRWLCV